MTRWLNKTALTCLPLSLLLAAGGAQAELLYDKDGRQLGVGGEAMGGDAWRWQATS